MNESAHDEKKYKIIKYVKIVILVSIVCILSFYYFYYCEGRTVVFYDEAGNVAKRIRYQKGKKVERLWEYEYDEAGREIKRVEYLGNRELVFWYECQYDENGNLIKEAGHDVVEGYVNVYDKYGNVVKGMIYQLDDGNITSMYTRNYDDKGKEKGSVYYNNDGKVARCHCWKYKKDKNGNVVNRTYVRTNYPYHNGKPILCERCEPEYDANGVLLRNVYYDSDGEIVYWYEYEYDENGKSVKETAYNHYDDKVDFWYEFQYDYDGNWIGWKGYNGDGSMFGENSYSSY